MAINEPTPASTSSDYDAMSPYWHKVSAILGGGDAIKHCGKTYLPKFPNETDENYKIRLDNAVLANVYDDVVSTLAAKPFAKEIEVETNSATIDALCENIDGLGNHIHVFAANWFSAAVNDAIAWVLVDYTKDVPAGATLADERAANARPYWVQIPARNLIAVYSAMVKGQETIVHARLREDVVERNGFGEVCRERVRVLDRELVTGPDGSVIDALPATWTLYEKQEREGAKEEWIAISNGAISIGEIALVPLITGKRLSTTWQVRPPMQACVDLQIEHYQQASAEKHLYHMAAFPILAGNGVTPAEDENGNPKRLAVGPMCALYAPMNGDGDHGEWQILEPAGESMDKVSARLERLERQIRELGRQPLTAQSGNITTVTAAFAGDKAMTVIEAWCLNAKDALENALRLTAKWLNETVEPEVEIDMDFMIGLKEDTGEDSLNKARERNDISQETWFDEMKRRGIISPNRTIEGERERIIAEMPDDPNADETDAANGVTPSQNDPGSTDAGSADPAMPPA